MGCGVSRGASADGGAAAAAAPSPAAATAAAAAAAVAATGAAIGRTAHEAAEAVEEVVAQHDKGEVAAAALEASNVAAGAASAVAAATGEALLELGKSLPWIGPVALLLGAIVKSAHDAKVLRADAQAFAVVARSVDAILLQVGTEGALASAQEPIVALKGTLEEGLGHCNKLAMQSAVVAVLLSHRDARLFEELQVAIDRQLQVITAAASITAANLQVQKFRQGEEIASHVAELGGPEAVAADPEKLAVVQNKMTASEALLIASVAKAEKSLMAGTAKLMSSVDALSKDAEGRHAAMERQLDRLTTMMQSLMAFKSAPKEKSEADAEEKPADDGTYSFDKGGTFGAALGEASTDEARFDAVSSGAAVRDFMKRMPMRTTEHNRLEFVKEMKLDTENASDLIGDEELADLVKAVQEAYGADMAFLGSVDGDAQSIIAGTAVKTEEGTTRDVDVSGAWVPKETTFCQHTMAEDAPVVFSHDETEREGIDRITAVDDMVALAQAGHQGYAGMLQALQAIGVGAPPGTVEPPASVPTPVGSVSSEGLAMLGENVFLSEKTVASVPVRIDGHAVATMCIVQRGKRDTAKLDLAKIEQAAEEAAEILKLRRQGKASHMLDATSFRAFVEDPETDSMCLLVTKGCKHCARMKTTWDLLGSRYRNPKFALYDITECDPPVEHDAYKVSAVPTAVLSPKLSRAPLRYENAPQPTRDAINALVSWIVAQGVTLESKTGRPSVDLPATRVVGAPEAECGDDGTCAVVPKQPQPMPMPSTELTLVPNPAVAKAADGTEAIRQLASAQALQLDTLQSLARIAAPALGGEASTAAYLDTVNRMLERLGTEGEAAAKRVNPAVRPIVRATIQYEIAARSVLLYKNLAEAWRSLPEPLLKGLEAASARLSDVCQAQVGDAFEEALDGSSGDLV